VPQIVLLGVCISPSPAGGDQYEQLSLQPMPLYSLPSDNVIMTCFASSAGGRLFMGGSDGNLYEIQYEATDTWRRRRCSKVRAGCGAITTLWHGNDHPVCKAVRV
jgi:nuclear pore complex protein Nup155